MPHGLFTDWCASGFPPYHPMVSAQGWDLERVETGLRNDTLNLVKAGYNVHGSTFTP